MLIGAKLTVSGVDFIDGTPILDIKPYIRQYDSPPSSIHSSTSHQVDQPSTFKEEDELSLRTSTSNCDEDHAAEVREAEWLQKTEVGNLSVEFTSRATKQLQQICGKVQAGSATQDDSELLKTQKSIVQVLSNDPRSTVVIKRKKEANLSFQEIQRIIEGDIRQIREKEPLTMHFGNS